MEWKLKLRTFKTILMYTHALSFYILIQSQKDNWHRHFFVL